MTIPDERARTLLQRLLADHPEWESGLEPGGPGERDYPKLRIPSAHPTIRTPLTVELGGTLQLFWHGGYFYDFLGLSGMEDALSFLTRFFDEEVRCGTKWRGGKVVGGGPAEDDDEPEMWTLGDDDDRVEIRSWRGDRDEIREAKGRTA